MCGDAVHAVGGRAGEDFVAPWDAEAAKERIDGFVRADAYEEVVWGEVLGRMDVGVAEVAEEFFKGGLMAGDVSMTAYSQVVIEAYGSGYLFNPSRSTSTATSWSESPLTAPLTVAPAIFLLLLSTNPGP